MSVLSSVHTFDAATYIDPALWRVDTEFGGSGGDFYDDDDDGDVGDDDNGDDDGGGEVGDNVHSGKAWDLVD